MPIKLQNCLFLIGLSFVGQMLYIIIGLLTLFHFDISGDTHYLIWKNLFFIAIIFSIINLCDKKIAQYIYTKSAKHLPRLRWYSMFISGIVIVHQCIKMDGAHYLMAVIGSCIVAALCYPKRPWKKRLTSACFFSILLCFCYICEYTSFKDF